MKFNILTAYIVPYIVLGEVFAELEAKKDLKKYKMLMYHTAVTEGNVFPYVVAILKKFSYVSAGALLDERWVLTAADSLFMLRETTRMIRVRLGSINYKKGGIVVPVKRIEFHPFFDDKQPTYDLALIKLAHRMRFSPTIYPIRMLKNIKEVTTTHFIVTAWAPSLQIYSTTRKRKAMPLYALKQRRILSLSHLHPTKPEECLAELAAMDVNDTQSLMCLDPDFKSDPCWRDTGAPVVLNGLLWGIVSSWRPDGCQAEPGTSFVALVAAKNISNWIHSTTSENKLNTSTFIINGATEEESSNELY